MKDGAGAVSPNGQQDTGTNKVPWKLHDHDDLAPSEMSTSEALPGRDSAVREGNSVSPKRYDGQKQTSPSQVQVPTSYGCVCKKNTHTKITPWWPKWKS